MVIKVSSIFRVDLRKNDHRQAQGRAKPKKQDPFKEILEKVLVSKKA